jgi:hypothetical protein
MRRRTTLLALISFGLAITASALLYPGGTWDERAARGFSFWNNFWCDLLSSRALNRRSNVAGSLLARLAFACFALALHRFWPQAVELTRGAPRPIRDARWIVRLGTLGASALLVVALVPASTSQLVHGIAVVSSAGLSLGSVALLLPRLFRLRAYRASTLGALVLGSALVCLGQYVGQGVFGHPAADWLAGMQKVTTAFLLAFMFELLMQPGAPSVDRRAPGS